MEQQLLRQIADRYLVPFFSGARIDDTASASNPRESTVSFINPQVIGFKVDRADTYRLCLRRDQPFAKRDDPARETRVIEAFVSILRSMGAALSSSLKDDLLSTFQRKVVAYAVADIGHGTELLAIIDQMALWANRLYEGAPIASAIGIRPRSGGDTPGLSLNAMSSHDFGLVLSNGFDSLLEFDKDLQLLGHRVLASPTAAHSCPWRHAAIAGWTAADRKRIAVVLNRLGEILVFRGGQLLFARRGGHWHFLTHGPITRQMAVPKDPLIRSAIYETALDASFARTGACFGVVRAGLGSYAAKVIAASDFLSPAVSTKAATVAQIVGGRKFQKLERTLRQELVAIDGATVIDHEGAVLAVGAILRIDSGSTGGGRTAAAKQLGTLGLGIKVSQDGGITGYRSRKRDGIAFRVM